MDTPETQHDEREGLELTVDWLQVASDLILDHAPTEPFQRAEPEQAKMGRPA